MARIKNALRGHFIAPYVAGEEEPAAEYLELAKWISNIGDNTNEETDDTGYYDGDGTKEESVVGIAIGYSFEGTYDPADEAQAMVAAMKTKIGDERKVWHKVVSSDGKTTWTGVANVSAIIAGAGEATEFEEFSCNITYIQIPKVVGP